MLDKKQAHNFVKQAMILAVASLVSRFIGFIYLLPLTATIGDVGNGIYGRAFYIYSFFLILSSAGMPAAISKLVAERVSIGRYDDAHRIFRVALVVAACFGAVCMGILFFGARFITDLLKAPNSYYSLIALSPTVFIVAIMAIYRGYFQGLGTMLPTSISQVVEQIFNAIFSVVLARAFLNLALIAADRPIYGAAGGTAGTGVGAIFGLLTVIIFYLYNRKGIKQSIKDVKVSTPPSTLQTPHSKIAWLIIRTAAPIIAGSAVLSFSNLIDATMATSRLMAGGFSPTEAEALYGQLSGKYSHMITLPISMAAVFATAVIPSISSSKAVKDSAAIESKINTALRLTMLICVPAAAGLTALGSPIIAMLFRQFPEGGMLLHIGAINVVFIALNQILTGPLQATGYMRIPVFAALCGSVVKVIANQFLIPVPQINIIGAVISTSLCYITAASINWHWLKKTTGARIGFIGLMTKPVACSVVMGFLCFIIHKALQFAGTGNTISTLIAILTGFTVYVILMVLFKGISKEDIRLLPFGKKISSVLEKRNLL